MKVALLSRMQFKDRHEAGILLARQISTTRFKAPRVFALPRGGVPVAAPLAAKLRVPLEVCLVRKLGSPRNPEFAMGALVEDGTWILNPGAERMVSTLELDEVKAREQRRIEEQRKRFRGGRPLPECRGDSVILVDDGMATGATMRAAVRCMKAKGAAEVVVAIPVCSDTAGDAIRSEGAEVLALMESDHLASVGQWYGDFGQVEDEEVEKCLEASRRPPVSGNPGHDLRKVVHALADLLQPLEREEDLAPLIRHFRDRKVVMLGESTHGTSEFYRIRDRLTRIFIGLEGFSFLAVEGDWPDLARLQRYVRHGKGRSARAVMQGFRRWPTWMWANAEMVDMVESFRQSDSLRGSGIHGLDLYSLFESMDCVLEYVRGLNPFLANALKQRYSCFEPYERDELAYARSLRRIPEGCAAQVVANLEALIKVRMEEIPDPEEHFGATQNARVVVHADNYYRALLEGDETSWNVRDAHMLDTLDLLLEKSEREGRGGKGVVWAHNTHIGDYRATNMEQEGYVNLGGLARRSFGPEQVGLIGFGTWTGQTLASATWGGREQRIHLPAAPYGSWDACFHEALKIRKISRGFVIPEAKDRDVLSVVLGQRALGVVAPSVPDSRGTFVPTAFSQRYDAFVFLDETTALHSLHSPAGMSRFPETWPGGT